MSDLCAVIDFGTNTARLLIAERSISGITPIRIEREIVRLGGGFTELSGISNEACERGIACLKRFSEIAAEYGVSRVMASATSAVRDAVNGAEFVDRVCIETGINLVVIDGNTEACLTLKGVLFGLESETEHVILLDVGGGSTEFTVSSQGIPVFVKSMPIGVVRLTEGFKTSDNMIGRVQAVIDELEKDLISSGITITEMHELVGTAGSATTIAAIKLEMSEYDYRKVNNFSVSSEDINSIYDRLSKLSPQERLSIKGLEKGREDLIIGGLIIIIAVMDRFGFSKMKVSDFGLLEGLALSG